MKKLGKKGFVATEILSVLFVPGAIPILILSFLYKKIKKPQNFFQQ